jgi:hypothetical protein
MKKYLFLCLFFCAACASGQKIITTETFSDVEMGLSEKELKTQLGTPDTIRKYSGGVQEYEYIERIIASDRNIQNKHYFFIIKDGVVISKRMVEDEAFRPVLERNAYDLQTSFNSDLPFDDDNK